MASTKDEIRISNLSPFGVEIAGIDLSQALTDAEAAKLKELFYEHHILVFHDQHLSLEEQQRFGKHFGRVHPTEAGTNYISNVRKDGYLGNLELKYHSDHSFCEYPIEALMLHAIEVDDGNTSTRFVNAVGAWDTLPEETKERLSSIQAVSAFVKDSEDESYDYDARLPHWAHPIGWAHPHTGRKILFVNPEHTRVVVGHFEAEGRALLNELYDHLYRPERVLEHVWRTGDVVLWDNVALQHARDPIPSDKPRTLQRVTIGKAPMLEQWPDLDTEAMQFVTKRRLPSAELSVAKS